MDALVSWIGPAGPAITVYPGGKVMDAYAVLANVPIWHVSVTRVKATGLSSWVLLSVLTGVPVRSRASWRLIVVTGLVHSTMALASTRRALVSTSGLGAEIRQLIVS
jgi:hypothetical protein